MIDPADFHFEDSDRGRVAVPTGDWTADTVSAAGRAFGRALGREDAKALDLSRVGRVDTAGAFTILDAIGGTPDVGAMNASPRVAGLLKLVADGIRPEPPVQRKSGSFVDMMDRLGHGLANVAMDFYDTMAFFGHLLTATFREARHPRRIRWAACFALAERSGLDAIPIVIMINFFIGAVVAFIGASALNAYGAKLMVINLVSWSVLREFNIVITAILLAGRSTSSFAAEIGSMKMNQEIDAMQTMGVDPFEALVLPRFVAMLLTLPLLTFVATVAGLAGGLAVCWLSLSIDPVYFTNQLADLGNLNNFIVGMSKTPVMAIIIAGVGCRQGMEVAGDVESLGRRVTSAVVHAIFSIIMVDAAFALMYNLLNV